MKYYKLDNKVYAFDADGSQNHLISSSMIEISEAEVAEHISPTVSLEETKIQAHQKITTFATQCREQIAGKADQYKLAGWNDKAQRAHRVLNSTPLDNDLSILQAECDKRGRNEIPIELATKHTQKAERLAIAISVIDGLESKALKALAAKTNESMVKALLGSLETEAQTELEKLL